MAFNKQVAPFLQVLKNVLKQQFLSHMENDIFAVLFFWREDFVYLFLQPAQVRASQGGNFQGRKLPEAFFELGYIHFSAEVYLIEQDENVFASEFLEKGEVMNTAEVAFQDTGAIWSGLRLTNAAVVRDSASVSTSA